jgi:hypothetical protein
VRVWTRRARWATAALAVLCSTLGVPAGTTDPAGAATTALTLDVDLTRTLGDVQSSTGTSQAWSSPAIGDITGDGIPEVVVAMLDGTVKVYRTTDHSVVWTRALAVPIQASPVLADVGGDRIADVVIATMTGQVYWFDGPTGTTQMGYAEGPPLFCPPGTDCRPHGFFATPSVADVTGDGVPEIVAASWDHTVYAWKRTGGLVFRRYLEDTLWSSPVVADVNHDGDAEVILGGDIWPGNPLGVPQGGLVWVLNNNGTTFPGYPISIREQTVWSSPAVVDLNRDGDLDIVVGTGGFTPYGDTSVSRRLYAFTAGTSKLIAGFPVTLPGRARNAPAVGDIDNDGKPEVVIGSEGGYVNAYNGNGSLLWRKCVANSTCSSSVTTYGSAVIADVDNDGAQEVIAALDKRIYVLNGASGAQEDAYLTNTSSPSLPAVGTDEDGNALIALQRGGTKDGSTNHLYLFSTGDKLCGADWPQFKKDARRSSLNSLAGPSWQPFDCARSFTGQQYLDFLGRPANTSGLNYWSSRLENGSRGGPSVIKEFMDSDEFGRVRSPLVRVYIALLDRPPTDYDTFADQATRFGNGTPLATIANEIRNTPGITDRSGQTLASKSNAEFVSDTFHFVQGRAPTSAEQQAGEDALGSGTSRGAWVVDRAEATSAKARLVPEVYVTMSYAGMLARVPNLSGFDFWVDRVRDGSSIQLLVASFQQSSEYAGRVT